MDEHTARHIDRKAEPALTMIREGIISPLSSRPQQTTEDLLKQGAQSFDNFGHMDGEGQTESLGLGKFLVNLMGVLRIILHSFALLVEVLIHYRFGVRAVSPAVIVIGYTSAVLIIGLSSGIAGVATVFGLMFAQAFTTASMGFLYIGVLAAWGFQWYAAIQYRNDGGMRHSFSSGQPLLYLLTQNDFFLRPVYLVFIEPLSLIILCLILFSTGLGAAFLIPSICLFLRNVIDNYMINNTSMNNEDSQIEAKYNQVLSSQKQAVLDDAIKQASSQIEQGDTLEPHIVKVVAEKGKGKAKEIAQEQVENFVVG